ncbi:MAG TPA: histidine kinase dimerization/phosphoacceptor domain-containing protein [Trebonia sp.]|nr:histidine kinase dimerization/phosphoacceptor domain-containing protein [Trebonia sp.]
MGTERDMSQSAGDHPPPAYTAYPGPADPRPPRPPLTKRMRTVHWIAVDCVAGGLYALFAAAVMTQGFRLGHANLLVSLLFMAVTFIPVALRRRAPATAFGGLIVLGVLLSGLAPTVPAVVFLAAAYVLYTVTVEGRRRTGAAALALVLVVMVFLAVAGGGVRPHAAAPSDFVPVALANVIAWMTGYSVRQRRLYVVTLQQQAANSAVAEERLRIARELHDVVAHSMSVIAVQAGYGQYVIDASPDGARDASARSRRPAGTRWRRCAACSACSASRMCPRARPEPIRPPGSRRPAPLLPAPVLPVPVLPVPVLPAEARHR